MQIKHDSRSCKFVSFSGIDGAGKSTQIANLRARLQDAGMRVALITFWDDVARLKRIREGAGHTLFKGEKGVGSPEKPVNRRDKNVRSWPMSRGPPGAIFRGRSFASLDGRRRHCVPARILSSAIDISTMNWPI